MSLSCMYSHHAASSPHRLIHIFSSISRSPSRNHPHCNNLLLLQSSSSLSHLPAFWPTRKSPFYYAEFTHFALHTSEVNSPWNYFCSPSTSLMLNQTVDHNIWSSAWASNEFVILIRKHGLHGMAHSTVLQSTLKNKIFFPKKIRSNSGLQMIQTRTHTLRRSQRDM